MTDLIYDYISAGVDMMIYAAILSTVIVLLRMSAVLTAYNANQNANAERVNYYKEYSMYDNTSNLSSADVLSAMVYYQYDIEIKVIIPGGHTYTTRPKQGGGYYDVNDNKVISYDDLKAVLGSTHTWSAKLYENGKNTPNTDFYTGGVISGIQFTRNN